MNSIQLISAVLVIFCILRSEGARKISCVINPGLNKSSVDENINVVYIVSKGENDILHYIWSTYKLPSIIVARTTKNTSFSVNTTKLISFLPDAITYKGSEPLDSLGFTFTKLWELHYPIDTSSIFDVSSVNEWDLKSLSWSDINETLTCSETFASAVLKATSDELPFSTNGTIGMEFSLSADQELSSGFPHLVFTGNSTMLKVVLDNLHSNSSKARFGLEISVFSDLFIKCKNNAWKVTRSKSINDEFSPGVFKDVQLLAPCSSEDKASSFISWRPVAYTGKKPIVANSSDVTMMKQPHHIPAGPIFSVAGLYFLEKSNTSGFNVTFGTEGDGFYSATLYTAWSLMLGSGQMVEIPLSSLVIYFAAIGLGLVMLFIISAVIFIVYQRCKEKDDDLLLN